MRSRARGGTYLPTYPVAERGVRRNDEWCGVRGAIDSSFNLVATHPSARPESCRGGEEVEVEVEEEEGEDGGEGNEGKGEEGP